MPRYRILGIFYSILSMSGKTHAFCLDHSRDT